MTTLPVSTLVQSIIDLLTEAYAGPPDARTTWFIDNQPDSGIFGLIAGVTAAEASQSTGKPGAQGETIAANIEHLRWSLANVNGALRGETYHSWKESWQVETVDTAAWDELRHQLKAEFDILCAALLRQESLPGIYLNGVLAMIPHASFHLGVLRQMLERVRAR
jgi:hypothetical protein